MALLRSGTRIYGNAKIDTVLAIDGQDAATSNTTGALLVKGGIGVAGNVFSSGNVNAIYFLGNGSQLTGISSSYNNANVANYLPTYTGNLSASNVEISGNLIVNGTLEYTNVTNLYVKDALIEQGGDSNGASLTVNDNKDRGSLLHYYNGSAIDAFIGWKTANSEFVVASNVTASNNTVTINDLGNIRANVFIGNLSGTASAATIATTVTASAQPNITSVGTLQSLSITNDLSAASIAGSLSTNAQPNITSVGTLSNLTISGNIFAGAIVSNLYNDTRIELGSGAGIIAITSTGNSTQFLPSGQINLGGASQIVGGTYSGSVIKLGTSQTDLIQNRGGNVTIQVGAGGTISKTWTFAQDGSFASPGNIATTGKITAGTANIGNIVLSNGISVKGTYGDKFDVLTSDGTGNTEWKSRYYHTDVMYDFTEYGMGYQTIAPNQDPITLGFLASVSIPYGSVWMLITNDGLTDTLPITIYSPSSKSTPMMWVTIDGNGAYDPDTNPGGSDYWFNITPPA